MDDRVVTCGYCGEKKGNARPFKESLLSKIEQEKEEEEEEEEDRWWIEGNDDRIYSPRFDEARFSIRMDNTFGCLDGRARCR